MKTGRYSIGPFEFEAASGRLTRDGEEIAIGRRAALILEALAIRGGQIVGKQVLIDAAWGEQAVEESNLSVQISQLRRILGAERIRTIERVGYRLVVARAVSRSDSRPAGTVPTLALTTSGGARADDFLGELTRLLVKFRSLRVTSEVAEGAGYVVSIAAGAAVQVRLVDRSERVVLWADRLEGDGEAILLERMASSIESEVHAAEMRKGAAGAGPVAEAYSLYLRGRRTLNTSRGDDNAGALTLFLAAVDLEPENAIYLAAATESIHHRLSSGWEPFGADDVGLCRELALRTMALANNDAVALALAGNGLFSANEEDLGLEICRRALAMNPNSQLVLACALLAERWGGSLEASEAISRRAISLAPNDPSQRFALAGLASSLSLRGEFEAAIAFGRAALSFGPGLTAGHFNIINGLMELGRPQDAEVQLGRYLAMAPGVTMRRYAQGQHFADRSRVARRFNNLLNAGLPAR